MMLYSRPKLSDFYTLSQTKLLENRTLHSGTYQYSLYMRAPSAPPPPPRGVNQALALIVVSVIVSAPKGPNLWGGGTHNLKLR